MMIFFSILFGLLVINMVLLVFSVNKLPKAKKQKAVYNKPNAKAIENKGKDKEYDVSYKKAI
ncbi:hypothetical protein I215_09963 [Galbibacter marinus]|uniref:Uncharacterized protein n=1 Tax=Galbibacter marinus TaxID=555500 RepID=K2Q212_9FLAO|nr:hypothetical protein [Galbibacter marinus]EKF54886.1 hypothetical protein I215_09963 [Galbibacter marinus]